jgi:hypothetical protein
MASVLWFLSLFTLLCSFTGWKLPFVFAFRALQLFAGLVLSVFLLLPFFAIVYGVGGPFALGGVLIVFAMFFLIASAATISSSL